MNNAMKVPGFTAEASLYKSTRLYHGYSGRTRLDTASDVVPAQSDCEIACGIADVVCLAACTFLGPFAPLCWAGCTAATVVCLSECQGGGGPPPCCPLGKSCRCGGTCVPGKGCVDGMCLGPNEVCP